MTTTRAILEGILFGALVFVAFTVFVEISDYRIVERGYYYQMAVPNQVAP